MPSTKTPCFYDLGSCRPGKKHSFFWDSKFMGALRKAYMTKAGLGVDFPKRGPYLFKGSYTFIVYYILFTYTVFNIHTICAHVFNIHTHIGRSRFFPFFWFFQDKSFEFDPRSKSALCQPLAWFLLNEDVLSAVPTTMDHYQVGRWRSLCQVHVFLGQVERTSQTQWWKKNTINTQMLHAGICSFAFTLLNIAILT